MHLTEETGGKQDVPQEETQQEVPKIIQPRDHKAKICVWADLTVDDVDRINESLNADHIKNVLSDIFGLSDHRDDLKTGIIMDLYYYTLQFARDNGFSREKTSAFFSIIKKTHEVCIETPFGNLDQTFNYFKALILCHAVNRPPHSIELFSADEVRKITEYTINTYFRHFKMYKYAFTPLVKLDLAINYIGLPMPSPPPSEAGDKADETEAKEGETTEEKPEEGWWCRRWSRQESPAKKELRTMIQTFLSEEIKKMKMSVEEQIKSTEDSINKKIELTDGSTSPKKSPSSPKGKKK
ncbi:LOW QUALITY PROTEIN: coiled-coil domain-containing protein 189-like [Haliotis rubra]|uniref:LOW QUALITY PROTEIN: coiled-coil domain-containing protein 189-like n=1 Tax=Haliotis rubra TaxID=36100 RepID=UPI001EE602EF|nr:LOW QUALITY PROTEIN: coiled-coil domain-containing protein 189-like [Haliotis rubra]